MTVPDLASVLGGRRAKPVPLSGNTPWAAQMSHELVDIVKRYSERRPRSMQKRLGPSELGVSCDRQVVGKLVGEAATNHVTDPWPSFMGTAGHAEMEQVMAWDNADRYGVGATPFARGTPRWATERKVTPIVPAGHPGSADLYDGETFTVFDHKFLGPTSLSKVKSAAGPPRKYVAQLGLYGTGYMAEGLRVDRVALIAWPRTESSMDLVYVWEHAMDQEMLALLQQVAADTARRKMMAEAILSLPESQHAAGLYQVPRDPNAGECYFCPFYRPHSEAGVGCDGKEQG